MTVMEVVGLPSRVAFAIYPASWNLVIAVIATVVVVVLWFLARAKNADAARKRRAAEQAGHDVGAFQGEGFEGHSTANMMTSQRDAAWNELFDPSTDAERLAQIAAAHPEFAAQIAEHPNAYAELRAWAASQRDS